MPLQRGRQKDSGFPARFPGECDECFQSIEVGDLIIGDALGLYHHVDCPEDADERPTKFQGTSLDEMGY